MHLCLLHYCIAVMCLTPVCVVIHIFYSDLPITINRNSDVLDFFKKFICATFIYDEPQLKMSHLGCTLVRHFNLGFIIFECRTHYHASSV